MIEFAETQGPKTIFAGGTLVIAIAGQLVDRGDVDEIPLGVVTDFQDSVFDCNT